MSSALAKAPEPNPGEAAKAAPKATANTLSYERGGVLGIAANFGRLLKGITYDAVSETIGPSKAVNMKEQPTQEKKDHKTAEQTKATTAPAVGEAQKADHDSGQNDASDKILHFLAHQAIHLGWGLPTLIQAVQWVKNELFPKIHEVNVDYDHLGDQILHKLKAGKKASKKKRGIIDHHELEGFCQGLDIPNLQRQFRMFVQLGNPDTTGNRLQSALNSESGRKEAEKEIAILLDMTGEVDYSEVERQTAALFERLGVDEHGHRHHLDSRVDGKHAVLIQIIKNARDWLSPKVLGKVYGTEEKEEAYELDYKAIGDRILKLGEKTLKPFLNRIQKDGIDDMEIAVGDLLNPLNIAAELGHNPDDLREQISNLFNVKGKVTKEKLEERKKQMEKKLKTGEDIDPYTPTRNAVVALINEAYEHLIVGDTLTKLYPTEDEKTFDWDYDQFSTHVLTKVNDRNRQTALRSFDSDSFDSAFSSIYPEIKPALLGSSEGKKRVRRELKSAFKLSEPYDFADVGRQTKAILKRLGNGTVEASKFGEIETRLTLIRGVLTADVVKTLFADISAVGPDKFVENFRDLETVEEIEAFIRGYKSSSFRGHFFYLFDEEELEEVITTGSTEDRNEAKREVREFVGLNSGPVRLKYFTTVFQEYLDTFNRVSRDDFSTDDQKRHDALSEDLKVIKTTLITNDRLDRLFRGEKIKELPTKYSEFGKQLRDLKPGEVPAYLMGFNGGNFDVHFRFINSKNILKEIQLNKDAIKKEIKIFTGLADNVGEEAVQRFVTSVKTKLTMGGRPQEVATALELIRILEEVQSVLRRDILEKIYK